MIRVENLCVRVGVFAFQDLSFSVETGKYAVLMGKTGSGKTTLVEAICGLRSVHSGKIVLRERDVTSLKPADRGVGYVPQDLALFPTMTVREHLSFALEVRKKRSMAAQRIDDLAGLLRIEHLLGRKPQGLSGGEAQRVALGRALSFQPDILLLDEPLSALDTETREEMYFMLGEVQRKTGVTTLHITHSPAEAAQLADVLLMLKDGRIRESPLEELTQRGTPA